MLTKPEGGYRSQIAIRLGVRKWKRQVRTVLSTTLAEKGGEKWGNNFREGVFMMGEV